MSEHGATAEIAQLLESQQLRAEIGVKGRLRVETESGPKLIKRISPDNLREQAFLMKRAIPGLCVHRRVQTFCWQEQLYQLIDLDPDLAPLSDPLEALAIVDLYTHADCIAMLTPKLDLDALVETSHTHYHFAKRDGHPRAREVALEPLIALFRSAAKELWPQDESRFRSGLFHEDLHTGNLLTGRGQLHVIDLDPLWHSYSVLNLAHFFTMEVLVRSRFALFEPLRAHFLAALREESERDFDFFVLLAIYRVMVRRAFHKDYFSESLHRDLAWHFQRMALELYLGRVRSGR